jgi:hypothetical protein
MQRNDDVHIQVSTDHHQCCFTLVQLFCITSTITHKLTKNPRAIPNEMSTRVTRKNYDQANNMQVDDLCLAVQRIYRAVYIFRTENKRK